MQKYSNSLTQHRRTRNPNVPLPQFNILLPLSFLRHFISWVRYVYINFNKNCCMLHLYCNMHPLPQLWLCVVTSCNCFVYTSLYSKCKLTHWDSVSLYVAWLASMSCSIFECLIKDSWSQWPISYLLSLDIFLNEYPIWLKKITIRLLV